MWYSYLAGLKNQQYKADEYVDAIIAVVVFRSISVLSRSSVGGVPLV